MPKTTPHDPSRPRRRRDPEATRAAILAAATKLFIERGVAATSTREIGRRAGVTKSLIHHHFGSKEELWNEVKRHFFSEYYDHQKALLLASDNTDGELLRESMVAYFRFLQHRPDAVRFMSWRCVEEDDICLDMEKELFELGAESIRAAQRNGGLRDDLDPFFLIKQMLALCEHWFQHKRLYSQLVPTGTDMTVEDERYLANIQRLFFDGARP